ncbi:MAG TPA: efflux RND transporter periplasmic adaptor subunit, partial [Candidatus Paceibacterota bacterium]
MADSQLKSDINFARTRIESILSAWNIQNGENNLPTISDFLDKVAKAVNSQTPTPSLTQTTIDGYKADMSSAKSTLITYRDALTSAKSALSLAERNLTLKKSGSTPEAINAEIAKVKQFEADFQSAKARLSKMTLRSPQNGVVTIQDAKVGETVTPGKNIISIISDSDLEIESNVSEVSVGKVALGNSVNLTFDAFPGKVFQGTVTYIEPAETIIDGVVNYKIRVAFSNKYPEMKSGLTSKLEIITGEVKDVIVVPQYSLVNKTDGVYVKRLVG